MKTNELRAEAEEKLKNIQKDYELQKKVAKKVGVRNPREANRLPSTK